MKNKIEKEMICDIPLKKYHCITCGEDFDKTFKEHIKFNGKIVPIALCPSCKSVVIFRYNR